MKYLGETFDLHTGGIDNLFPHHENEIAFRSLDSCLLLFESEMWYNVSTEKVKKNHEEDD